MSGKDIKRIFKRLVRGVRPIKNVSENIWVLSPLAIPFKHHWKIIRMINQGWMKWTILRFIQRYNFKKPLIWTYHPYIIKTVSAIEAGKVVYHCVDDLSAIPGIEVDAFNAEEEKLLKKCDVVFTTTIALFDKCKKANENTHYLPNVADAKHFGAARNSGPLPYILTKIPKPRIVYIGMLSDYKVDFELIFQIAQKRPEWSWVLIGEEREGQRNTIVSELRKLKNVHFIGYVKYDSLPEYLRGIDVGTLPTLINKYTHSMFPMKYFEYLSAGVPVVSTPLHFVNEHNDGMVVASGEEEFEKAIERQLKRGKLSESEVEEFVGDNTWSYRLDKMLSLIDEEYCKRKSESLCQESDI